MCGNSSFNQANSFCCPEPQIFTEDLCGSVGPNPGAGQTTVWFAPAINDYFQGTFTVRNTGASALVIGEGGVAPTTPVPLDSTVSISVTRPTAFVIGGLGPGTSADYCIKLYKRVLV